MTLSKVNALKYIYIKIIKLLLLFIISTNLLQASDIKSKSTESILMEELKKFNLKNPKQDVAKNLKNNDMRFIGVYGFVIMLPGIPDEYKFKIAKQYGIRAIEGTSDKIESSLHSNLISSAYGYAYEYNQALVKALREKDYISSITINKIVGTLLRDK